MFPSAPSSDLEQVRRDEKLHKYQPIARYRLLIENVQRSTGGRRKEKSEIYNKNDRPSIRSIMDEFAKAFSETLAFV
jgi:hypothetical protein